MTRTAKEILTAGSCVDSALPADVIECSLSIKRGTVALLAWALPMLTADDIAIIQQMVSH